MQKWPAEMFPKKGRTPWLPDDQKTRDRVQRREEAYRKADREYAWWSRRKAVWTHELEQPITMLRRSVVRSLEDIPLHRRCFYPKQRVPKQFMPEPQYARIAQRVRELKQMLAHDENLEHVVRDHVETIHEEEHILQIAAAMETWDQALLKRG